MSTPSLLGTGLTIRFGGLVAVDGVDIRVDRNEVVGLLGPNGAGKTTLFNILAGLHVPTSGRVTFEGQDITAWPMARRARAGLARTFQIVRPFPSLTVLENVLAPVAPHAGRLAARRERAMDNLGRVGLAARAGDMAGNLTLGMLKRLEVARVLMLEPKLMLLDEPLAGLSVAEAREVLALVTALSERTAIVIVEHNIQLTLPVCHRALVLERGRIIAEGPPAALRRDPAVIAAYLGTDPC